MEVPCQHSTRSKLFLQLKKRKPSMTMLKKSVAEPITMLTGYDYHTRPWPLTQAGIDAILGGIHSEWWYWVTRYRAGNYGEKCFTTARASRRWCKIGFAHRKKPFMSYSVSVDKAVPDCRPVPQGGRHARGQAGRADGNAWIPSRP